MTQFDQDVESNLKELREDWFRTVKEKGPDVDPNTAFQAWVINHLAHIQAATMGLPAAIGALVNGREIEDDEPETEVPS